MSSVYFSPAARQDLNEIWSYIAGDSPEAATRFVDSIERQCESLVSFSNRGRVRNELGRGLRSIPFGNYLIFYRPAGNQVEIVRVLSGYRDLEAQFEQ